MSFDGWLNADWISPHKTTAKEISDFLAMADRDIEQAGIEGLGLDWKFNIAYNAALTCAAAALAAAGYRVSHESHHYRLIQSLTLTLGRDYAQTVTQLDGARKKRNLSVYERAGIVSEKEANALLETVRQLRRDVEDWLQANHPNLLSP